MNPFIVSHNFDQAINLLQQLSSRYSDLSPAMQKIEGVLADETEQAFANQADPTTGAPWPELSKNYLKQNPERAQGQMLQLSGQLAASVTTSSGDFWAQIGSNKEYAAIHNFGGDIQHQARTQSVYFKQNKNGSVGNRFVKKKNSNFEQTANVGPYTVTMPARAYVGVSPQGDQDIIEILKGYLLES